MNGEERRDMFSLSWIDVELTILLKIKFE